MECMMCQQSVEPHVDSYPEGLNTDHIEWLHFACRAAYVTAAKTHAARMREASEALNDLFGKP